MGISKVKTGFTRYTDGNLLTKGNYIVGKVTSNTTITSTTPSATDVGKAVGNFGDSIVAAQDGTKEDTVTKKAMRAALILELNSLGLFVQTASGGDPAIILSMGYDVVKTRAYVGLLAKPENFLVNAGPNSGSMALSAKAVPQSDFYEFESQLVDADAVAPADWITQTSTKRSCIISGLTPGAQYNFRVAGAGSNTGRVYSDVITKFVS